MKNQVDAADTTMLGQKKTIADLDKELAERIKAIRISKGISLTAVAEACGITFQQIQKYESGKNRISGGRLMLIAQCLRVTPGSLLGEDGGALPDAPSSRKRARLRAELADAISALDSEPAQRAVLDFITTLKAVGDKIARHAVQEAA